MKACVIDEIQNLENRKQKIQQFKGGKDEIKADQVRENSRKRSRRR